MARKKGGIMSREIKYRAWLEEEKKMVDAYLLRTTFLEDIGNIYENPELLEGKND